MVHKSIVHDLFFQEEMEQVRLELKHLEFREEVLKKQKELLAKFANNISTVHSMKVTQECSIPVSRYSANHVHGDRPKSCMHPSIENIVGHMILSPIKV